MVSSKKIGFKLKNTFEHFVFTFDTGYTSAVQINIFSIQKHSFDFVNKMQSEGPGPVKLTHAQIS